MADIIKPRFLLASLHIEAILRGTTVARRRNILKSIKDGSGLGDAYGATLEQIKAQDEERAKLAVAALTWICHSERPLQVDELCHALAVEIGEKDFDPENVPSIDTLLDCCQGLITVDAEASTVRLIHNTVQEYLCSHPGLFSKPHSILAETCLTYLNSQLAESLTPNSLPDPHGMPFLKYSARYWGAHTNRDLSDNARALALELLNRYEDHISARSLLEQVLQPINVRTTGTPLAFSGLHCASFFGIVELVTVLINSGGYKINQQDCVGSTPLVWAAKNGHVGVVKLLLEQGNVDPNRQDNNNRTPIGWAALRGHERVVKLLLELENVNPDHPDKYDTTPLGLAALNEHEGVAKILLELENVDPNHPDTDGLTPLGLAALHGHEGVVKLLLGCGTVDPNRADVNDRTPVGGAARYGYQGVVKLLLEQENVDPNLPDKDGTTPLGWAAHEGHEAVVKLLLERENVDPDRPDKDGTTPLGWAALNGHEGVVKLLLERRDAEPDRPDTHSAKTLSDAAREGHRSILLLPQAQKSDLTPDSHARKPARWDVWKRRIFSFKKKPS